MRNFCIAFLIILFSFSATTATAQQKYASLNHVAVYVNNLKTTTDFYTNILQLEVIPEPFHDGKHTWFKVGEHAHLHLIEGAKEITTHDKNGHLCFSVPSVESFIPKLQKAGIAYEDWPGKPNAYTTRVDGVKQIYFKDPEGNWIEINDDKY